MARSIPAFALDGCVLELDTRREIAFAYDKSLSPSHSNKLEAKEEYRMLHAAKLAHSACELEFEAMSGNVVCVDSAGNVQNFHQAAPASPNSHRMKIFHKKRVSRAAQSDVRSCLTVDENGLVRANRNRSANPFYL